MLIVTPVDHGLFTAASEPRQQEATRGNNKTTPGVLYDRWAVRVCHPDRRCGEYESAQLQPRRSSDRTSGRARNKIFFKQYASNLGSP